ncbi:YwqG family protein [Bacillus cereus]|uniref:YwqG family protein n=1 Tax=Bacillus cereus TaxID=1396 RepID=UPI0039808562
MKKQIESLIDKYELAHLKQELIDTIFPCIKVVPKQMDILPIGSSKMGGVPDVPVSFEYPTYEGNSLDFIAQFNLTDLQDIGMNHNLPEKGMLYFFYYGNHFVEEINQHEAGCVLYCDVSTEQLQRMDGSLAKFTQCEISFELTYKLPELFIEDEEDSDRFLQLLEELIPDHYDNHQLLGEPFSVQEEVFQEAGECIGTNVNNITLLFQVDSDYQNCNMIWGDLGMLYFCIDNDDLKHHRFENTCVLLQTC